jgi:hypothetical protein
MNICQTRCSTLDDVTFNKTRGFIFDNYRVPKQLAKRSVYSVTWTYYVEMLQHKYLFVTEQGLPEPQYVAPHESRRWSITWDSSTQPHSRVPARNWCSNTGPRFELPPRRLAPVYRRLRSEASAHHSRPRRYHTWGRAKKATEISFNRTGSGLRRGKGGGKVSQRKNWQLWSLNKLHTCEFYIYRSIELPHSVSSFSRPEGRGSIPLLFFFLTLLLAIRITQIL